MKPSVTVKTELEPLLLTPDQAAALCNTSRDRIDDWTHRVGFPVIRDGKAVLIPLEPLKAWLAEQAAACSASASTAESLARLPVLPASERGRFRIGTASNRRPGEFTA